MGMTTIVSLLAIVECLVLVVCAVFLGASRRIPVIVAALASILVLVVGLTQNHASTSMSGRERDVRESLYLGASLIKRGQDAEALDALSPFANFDEYEGSDLLYALAYNHNDAWKLSCLSLEERDQTSGEVAGVVYDCSYGGRRVPSDTSDAVCDRAISSLALTDAERQLWDKVLDCCYGTGESSGSAQVGDDYRLRARDALKGGQAEAAYDIALKAAHKGDVQACITLSELYLLGYGGVGATGGDGERDAIVGELARRQAVLDRMCLEGTDEGDEAYAMARADVRRGLQDLDALMARRSREYLLELDDVEDYFEPHMSLQLGYLSYVMGDLDAAKEHIDAVFGGAAGNQDHAMSHLLRACLDAVCASGASEVEFSVALRQLMDYVHGCVCEPFADDGFASFVRDCLEDGPCGVRVVGVDSRDGRQVHVRLACGDATGDLLGSGVEVRDTGDAVSTFDVSAAEAQGGLTACFLVDTSESMAGAGLDSAKEVVSGSLTDMPDGVRVSLVGFSDAAEILCRPTRSAEALRASLGSLTCGGGTSLSAGIRRACDVLADEEGRRVIVLVSDGVDLDASLLGDALVKAQRAGIGVYAVGTSGCDSRLLAYVADQTRGLLTLVDNRAWSDAALPRLRELVPTTYTLAYPVPPDETDSAYVEVLRDGALLARAQYVRGEADGAAGANVAASDGRSTYWRESDYGLGG